MNEIIKAIDSFKRIHLRWWKPENRGASTMSPMVDRKLKDIDKIPLAFFQEQNRQRIEQGHKPNTRILKLRENPQSKLIQVEVNWYHWESMKAIMESHGWNLDQICFHVFDTWARVETWLENDDEFKQMWDSICDAERERMYDVMPYQPTIKQRT